VAEERIAVAFITKSWGVRGEVIAEILTHFPERFKRLKKVYLSGDRIGLEATIKSVKLHGNKVILKFEEIEDRNQADKLRNTYVEIGQGEVFPLPNNQYYRFDLIGLEVVEQQGRQLGVIADIYEYPAADILVIQSPQGRLLIPCIKEYIKSVNLNDKRVEVVLLPGMEFEAE